MRILAAEWCRLVSSVRRAQRTVPVRGGRSAGQERAVALRGGGAPAGSSGWPQAIDAQRAVSGVYRLLRATQRAAGAPAALPAWGLGIEALEVGAGEDPASDGGHGWATSDTIGSPGWFC